MTAVVFSTLGNLLFWAVVLTLMVLSVRPTPGTDARTVTEAAQKYARRIGIVALATAMWLPGVLRPALVEVAGELWWDGHFSIPAALLQLGPPTVFALAVLAAGELTWPRPRGAVRTAVLRHRGLRTLMPGYMTGVALVFLVLDLLVLGTVLQRDPFSPPARALLFGWLPWVLLTAGATAGILKLISVRPMVPGTTVEADAALRRASAHRVLRVAAALLMSLNTSGAIFLSNYPSPPGLSQTGDVLRFISLPVFYLGLFALLKRAPRVPLPEVPENELPEQGEAPPQSPLAVKSLATSLRLTLAGPVTAAAAGSAIFALIWQDRAGALLAAAGAAVVFLLLCFLAEASISRRTVRLTAGAVGAVGTVGTADALDPDDLAFVRPPRWLAWTGTGAAAAVLLIQLGSLLLGPSVDAAARVFNADAAAQGYAARTPPATPPADFPAPDPFFDWRFALAAAVLVLMLPVLTDFLSRRVLLRPAFPAADRSVDLRLRRVALFRLSRTTAAFSVAAIGLSLFNLSLHSPWAHSSWRGTELEPPLTWLGPLVQQAGAGAWLWLLAALVIALRQFGPSHFPDLPGYAERADLPPAQQA
ncbi:hypothetical protein H9638_08975 [Arthrobacter sp. Sa2BUA2]|uniref:Copper resistance protein D domain-containing protein n=1 Tax=Arthrobacter pullicola TaxID=2762224 RepID=A0ABR8YI76_9MICC|nr:hypothetical protein [Arthrobacter pullicola]MBD8043936.1 hypothetical protein [Arthrobacter pullicola]